jgi:hypothetical protein
MVEEEKAREHREVGGRTHSRDKKPTHVIIMSLFLMV